MPLTTTQYCLVLLAMASCLAPPLRADDCETDRALTPVNTLDNLSENERFTPTTRPATPEPQQPPMSNDNNVDTGKPIQEWQRATDDWWGLRPKLDDHGITLQANLALDTTWDLAGGANRGSSAVRYLFNTNLTLNTERLAGLKGGTFFVNFQNRSGKDGSAMIGSAQAVSNIDSNNLTQVSELWYQHVLWDDKIRVKVGKVDAGTEFARVENGGEFLNASFGVSPTVVGFPGYPNPATSANLFATPLPWFYGAVGVYDGSTQEGTATGPRGPGGFGHRGLFCIGEAGFKWGTTLRGRLGAGAWHHTATFNRFDGNAQTGTTGYYLTFDQQLWPGKNPDVADNNQGIAVFAQYGWADPLVSPFEHHAGAGFAWTGPIPGRESDILGLGATYVRLTPETGAGFDLHDELAVELFYKVQALKWLSIKPDLQYIHNPGGLNGRDDAIAATIRVQLDF